MIGNYFAFFIGQHLLHVQKELVLLKADSNQGSFSLGNMLDFQSLQCSLLLICLFLVDAV